MDPLLDVMREARDLLARPGNDFSWSWFVDQDSRGTPASSRTDQRGNFSNARFDGVSGSRS
jgi:hypothetical protein